MVTSAELRSRILARIWQVIAQQDISDSELSKDKQTLLAEKLADAITLEVGTLAEAAPQAPAVSQSQQQAANTTAKVTQQEEQTLWRGRPLLSLVTRYVITTERISVIRGLLGRSQEDIELVRIQDIDNRQRFGQRLLGIGTIYVNSADPSSPNVTLKDVKHPGEVHELLRRAMLNQRKASNFAFRQEFGDNS